MTMALEHTWYMTVRYVRALVRQPWYVALTLIQPIIWLLLFGALFKKIVEIPGFASTSYITFLTPGIVVMTAMFSGGWGGMGVIDDLDRGVMDRFLVSPVSRGSVLMGRVVQTGFVAVLQSLIMVGLAYAVGAHFPGGAPGVIMLIIAAILLSTGIGSLSNGLALVLRREESVIAASNFILLPLTFLSSAFLQQNLAPRWIQDVATYNPVNWAIEVGRGALGAQVDWTVVLSHTGYLFAFSLFCAWVSTRAFRSYQRSV
jgi:ABC-2 type transport system permease protein